MLGVIHSQYSIGEEEKTGRLRDILIQLMVGEKEKKLFIFSWIGLGEGGCEKGVMKGGKKQGRLPAMYHRMGGGGKRKEGKRETFNGRRKNKEKEGPKKGKAREGPSWKREREQERGLLRGDYGTIWEKKALGVKNLRAMKEMGGQRTEKKKGHVPFSRRTNGGGNGGTDRRTYREFLGFA